MNDVLAGLFELPNLHPVVVPVPIGLLAGSVLLDLLAFATGAPQLWTTGRWTLWLGTLGLGLAILTGDPAAESVGPFLGADAEALMERHHELGMIALVACGILSVWRLVAPARWRAQYLLLAAATLAIVAIGADLGGLLVFRHGVGVRATADSLQGRTGAERRRPTPGD